jgi:hypothetical protein
MDYNAILSSAIQSTNYEMFIYVINNVLGDKPTKDDFYRVLDTIMTYSPDRGIIPAILETIVASGADIAKMFEDTVQNNKFSGIFAASSWSPESVAILLRNPTIRDAFEKLGDHVFNSVVHHRNLPLLKYLIDNGYIRITEMNVGKVLNLASGHGDFDLVEYLLSLGVEPAHASKLSITRNAAIRGNIRTLRLFIRRFNLTKEDIHQLIKELETTISPRTIKYLRELL